MPARREAQDSHAIGVDAPLAGLPPGQPDRPLRVLEHRRMMILGREAILDHDPRHAERVEPLGDLLALVLGRQERVTAARTDDHRRTRGRLLGRQPDGDRRHVARVEGVLAGESLPSAPGAPSGQSGSTVGSWAAAVT